MPFSSGHRRVVAAGVALACIGSTVLAQPAQAAHRGACITRREFRHVHQGQSLQRVARIVGDEGTRIFATRRKIWIAQEWPQCGDPTYGYADVWFNWHPGQRAWRETEKQPVWI